MTSVPVERKTVCHCCGKPTPVLLLPDESLPKIKLCLRCSKSDTGELTNGCRWVGQTSNYGGSQ
jgi:hypothetical protein